jgi:hypothetical protein
VAVPRSNARCHVAGKPRSARVIAGRRVSLSGQGHRGEPVESNFQLIDSCHYSALTGPGQGRHRAVRHSCIEAKGSVALSVCGQIQPNDAVIRWHTRVR